MLLVCKTCGYEEEVPDDARYLNGFTCSECRKIQQKKWDAEYRVRKRANARNKNKLDEFCEEARSKGYSYAQYQVMETVKRERAKKNGR